MISVSIFRENDIRGIVPKDLSEDTIELVGKSFGTFMASRGHKKIVVGHDVRISYEWLKNALVKGVMSTGIDVMDIGLVPTPVLFFSILYLVADGGMMITGSHNPIDYNGIRLWEGSMSIYGRDIQALKRSMFKNEFIKGSGISQTFDVIPAYIDMLKSKFFFLKNLKS